MPYRGAPPLARTPEIALTAAARLLGIHGAAQALYRCGMVAIAYLARREVYAVAYASEHGGPRPTSFPFRDLEKDGLLWMPVPELLALFVIVAGVLIALRTKGRRRVQGAIAGILGTLAALLFSVLSPHRNFVFDASFMRVGEALLALSQVPLVWALSQPGKRTLAWLTTAFSVALSYSLCVEFIGELRSVRHDMLRGDAAELFSYVLVPLLTTLPFVFGALAGFSPLREDLRGPPPEPPQARTINAALVSTLSVATIMFTGGIFAGLGDARDSWGTWLNIGGIDWLAMALDGAIVVGGIATASAAFHLPSRLFWPLMVVIVLHVALGLPAENVHAFSMLRPLEFDGHYFLWALSTAAIVLAAAWLAREPFLGFGAAFAAAAALSSTVAGWAIGPTAFLLTSGLGFASLGCLAVFAWGFRVRMADLAEAARHSAAAATS